MNEVNLKALRFPFLSKEEILEFEKDPNKLSVEEVLQKYLYNEIITQSYNEAHLK